jgi:cytochrome c
MVLPVLPAARPMFSMRIRIGALAGAWLALGVAVASADGDPIKGEQIYHRCQGCHSIDRNRVGPMHKGLFGRTAGSVPGFAYSSAMKNAGIVWSEDTLDQFLQGPRKMVPGTKMTYGGVADPQDRADLIAYLKQATK